MEYQMWWVCGILVLGALAMAASHTVYALDVVAIHRVPITRLLGEMEKLFAEGKIAMHEVHGDNLLICAGDKWYLRPKYTMRPNQKFLIGRREVESRLLAIYFGQEEVDQLDNTKPSAHQAFVRRHIRFLTALVFEGAGMAIALTAVLWPWPA